MRRESAGGSRSSKRRRPRRKRKKRRRPRGKLSLRPKKRGKMLNKIRINLMIEGQIRRNQGEPKRPRRPVLQRMQKKTNLCCLCTEQRYNQLLLRQPRTKPLQLSKLMKRSQLSSLSPQPNKLFQKSKKPPNQRMSSRARRRRRHRASNRRLRPSSLRWRSYQRAKLSNRCKRSARMSRNLQDQSRPRQSKNLWSQLQTQLWKLGRLPISLTRSHLYKSF